MPVRNVEGGRTVLGPVAHDDGVPDVDAEEAQLFGQPGSVAVDHRPVSTSVPVTTIAART